MKIKRYQSGGIYYTPFFRDSVAQQSQTTSSTTKEDKEDQLIQKEIITVLKENGLQNDVDYFLSKANSLLNKTKSLFGDSQSSYDMSDLIRVVSLGNRVRRNFETYNSALTQITKEGAGSDIALSNEGGLYAYDKSGKLQVISATKYHENSNDYSLLTNTDLLKLRESQPELAYNSSILTDMTNVVGMQSIVNYIKGTISAFGTNKETKSNIRFTEKKRNQIEKGLEQILGGTSPDGIYKINEKSTISDQGYGSGEELVAAVDYLYNTLNSNMKNVLRANAAAQGLNPNSAKDVQKLLIMAVQEHTDHSREYDPSVTYEATMSKNMGKGNGNEGSTSLTPDTWGHMITQNRGIPTTHSFVMKAGNVSVNLPAYSFNTIRDMQNKEVDSITSLGETLQNLSHHGVRDSHRQAYFGGLPLDITAANSVLIDNSRGAQVTFMPVDTNGNVDFLMFQQMTEIQEKITSKRITDPMQKKQIWENEGYSYNEQLGMGQPIGYTLAPYWVQSAFTSTAGNAFERKDLKTSPFISSIDDTVLESRNNLLNATSSKKNAIDITPGWFGNSYESLIFVPINNNELETMIAGGIGYTSKEDTDYVHAQQQTAYRSNVFNNGVPNWSLNGTSLNDLD